MIKADFQCPLDGGTGRKTCRQSSPAKIMLSQRGRVRTVFGPMFDGEYCSTSREMSIAPRPMSSSMDSARCRDPSRLLFFGPKNQDLPP